MSDDDMIRRGDALKIALAYASGEGAALAEHAIRAIAKLSAGDGLVERLLARQVFLEQEWTGTAWRDVFGPDPLTSEAAAHIAALTAQNREMALDVLASSGQAQEAYAAQLAAEAEAAALTAQLAEAEREAESRSAMFATACEERNAAEAKIATMIEADAVQAMLDAAQPIMAEACRGYEEQIAALTAERRTLRLVIDANIEKHRSRAEAAEAEAAAMRDRVEKDAKAHEKEIAVWAENYAALTAQVARLEGVLTDMPKAVLRTTVCQGPVWPDDRPGVWLAALEACAKSVQAAVDAALTDGGSNE